MRQPIAVDRPTTRELSILKDCERATSLVYEHLITIAGLGIAERWIEALDVSRAPAVGWILSTTTTSERIAKKTYPFPPVSVMELSMRAWEAAKTRDKKNRPHAYLIVLT